MKKKKIAILPYALRKKIWHFIHRGKTNRQIVEEIFKEAEPYVTSDTQLIQGINSQRSLHNRGIKPDPKSIISSLVSNGQIRLIGLLKCMRKWARKPKPLIGQKKGWNLFLLLKGVSFVTIVQ